MDHGIKIGIDADRIRQWGTKNSKLEILDMSLKDIEIKNEILACVIIVTKKVEVNSYTQTHHLLLVLTGHDYPRLIDCLKYHVLDI